MQGEEYVVFELSDFQYNAGVLGLHRIFSESMDFPELGEQIVKVNNQLKIPLKLFENFEERYIEYFVIKTKKQSVPLNKVLNDFEKLNWSPETKEDKDKLKEWEKYAKDKLERNSFKSAYKMIAEHYKDPFDAIELIKNIKAQKESFERKPMYESLLLYIQKYQHVFYMKEASYTWITRYWSGVSFLDSKKPLVPFDKAIKEHFVEPLKAYISTDNSKRKNTCFQCGGLVDSKEKRSMSWIEDFGVDIQRKKSHYWNFQPDTSICPKCNLVYSCMPAGFNTINGHGLFVNDNSSMHKLVATNNPGKSELLTMEELESQLYLSLAEAYSYEATQVQHKEAKQGIQVVRRHQYHGVAQYHFNLLSVRVLEAIGLTSPWAKQLTKLWYKEHSGSKSLPLFTQVINYLNDQRNLHSIMDGIFRNSDRWYSIQPLAYIQTAQDTVKEYYKGNRKEGAPLNKRYYARQLKVEEAFKKGNELRQFFREEYREKSGNIESRLSGPMYKLLNALKQGDRNTFMDTLLRLYMWKNKDVPRVFVDALNSENEFETIGYAFLAGIKGAAIKGTAGEANNTEHGEV